MDASTAPRRRPFGVIVVALLQLGTVVVALVAYFGRFTLPWEGSFAQLLADSGWARVAIVGFAVLVAAATIGMWFLRTWGWALMVTLVCGALVLDITTWASQGDQDRNLVLYLRMALDVVSAFYLNSSAVQNAFRGGQGDAPMPIEATASAGRVDP